MGIGEVDKDPKILTSDGDDEGVGVALRYKYRDVAGVHGVWKRNPSGNFEAKCTDVIGAEVFHRQDRNCESFDRILLWLEIHERIVRGVGQFYIVSLPSLQIADLPAVWIHIGNGPGPLAV